MFATPVNLKGSQEEDGLVKLIMSLDIKGKRRVTHDIVEVWVTVKF